MCAATRDSQSVAIVSAVWLRIFTGERLDWTSVATLLVPAREVRPATPRTRIIVIDLDGHAFAFNAGQAVFAGLADSSVRRPYSIACSPEQAARDRSLELLVQIDDHSAPDPHLERATPGRVLSIEGPFGSFALPTRVPEHHLLLIAGGTGIAPLRSIMWHVLEVQPEVAVSVAYSARTAAELAYLSELTALAGDQRIILWTTVTRDDRWTWTGRRGRLDKTLLGIALKTPDSRCVVCGPSGFVADVSGLLRSAGVVAERIVTETYTSS